MFAYPNILIPYMQESHTLSPMCAILVFADKMGLTMFHVKHYTASFWQLFHVKQ